MTEPSHFSPTEFRERWPSDRSDDVVLLDVRELAERSVARVEGTYDIPMNEIPGRMAELPKDRPIVVMCHSGVRSLKVAQFLAAQGFDQVFNLTGGIDAWSREVDSTIPRY
jgi:rhodanese-related sulfurtransferase